MIDHITISKNANLICTFLELSIVDKRAKKNPEYHIPFSNIPCLAWDRWADDDHDPWIEKDTEIRASDTLFHSDWNWLMVVVNKFKEVWRREGFESMSRETDKLAQNIYIDTLNIEYTYKAVVEFIKWYNQQKK